MRVLLMVALLLTAAGSASADWSTINSNNGASLTSSPGNKLRALRCWVMQFGGGANYFSCSGDTCTASGLTIQAKECVDQPFGDFFPDTRRCRMWRTTPAGTTKAWYLWYETATAGAWWTSQPYQSQSAYGCTFANHTLTN